MVANNAVAAACVVFVVFSLLPLILKLEEKKELILKNVNPTRLDPNLIHLNIRVNA